ncbi:uncharacterized protein LOC120341452 isoform X2 [Styela clava]
MNRHLAQGAILFLFLGSAFMQMFITAHHQLEPSIASPFVGEFYEKPTIDPMERPTDSE